MTSDSRSGSSSGVQRVQSASSSSSGGPGRKEDDFASILDDEEAGVENISHFYTLIQTRMTSFINEKL